LEESKLMKYNWSMFDFSLHRHRNRKKDIESEATRLSQEAPTETFEHEETSELVTEEEGKSTRLLVFLQCCLIRLLLFIQKIRII
jgi:hypothetical protein